MTRFLLSVSLVLLALTSSAGEAETPVLPDADRDEIAALFSRLRDVFLSGNHRTLSDLLVTREDGDKERVAEIVQAVRREFKSHSYVEFEVREWAVEEALGNRRLDLWVSLRTVCTTPDSVRVENFHNDVFLIERQPDGHYLLAETPFFLTLGRQQGVGLIADALLAAIGCLVGLTFWVWMGFEAYTLRPRQSAWRATVMLVPLLGAFTFFFVCYLPGLFRRPQELAEGKSRSGLTNHV